MSKISFKFPRCQWVNVYTFLCSDYDQPRRQMFVTFTCILQHMPTKHMLHLISFNSSWPGENDCHFKNLTLLVLRLEYSSRTRSISWLPMPWLLVSPGHQQPWYWECEIHEIGRPFGSMRVDFNLLRHLRVEKLEKIQVHFNISSIEFSMISKGLLSSMMFAISFRHFLGFIHSQMLWSSSFAVIYTWNIKH